MRGAIIDPRLSNAVATSTSNTTIGGMAMLRNPGGRATADPDINMFDRKRSD